MRKLCDLLHFYYRQQTRPTFGPVARIGICPEQQGVRKPTRMISLEKIPQSKPPQPHHTDGSKLTLVKTPRAPHPRLIEVARILARQAAQEAFAQTVHATPIH